MPIPDLTEVKSSNLHSIGRDGPDLIIRFRGKGGVAGPAYRYAGAADVHHDALMTADSAGRYFLANIKAQHPAEKVEA